MAAIWRVGGHPRDPAIASWFGGGGGTESGENVTADTATKSAAVLACVRVISETLAMLPVSVMQEKKDGGKRKAVDHPLHEILHRRPNRWQTPYQFKKMMAAHVLLRGNAYAQIISSPTKPVVELIPLHPDRVTPFWAPDGDIAYRYEPETGPAKTFLRREILHWSGLFGDLLGGQSVISYAAEAIGLSIAAEKYGGRFLVNDATPPGVLKPTTAWKDDEEKKKFLTSWQEAHTGKRKFSTALLPPGMEYESIGVSGKDSQLLELRQFQIADIARAFRVPAHKINDLLRATFSNIEHMGMEFVQDTMLPYVIDFEQIIERDLFLTPSMATGYYVKFNFGMLLRGDMKTRYEAYGIGMQWGILNPNESRAFEDMEPYAGGEKYWRPLNMIPADAVATPVVKTPGQRNQALDVIVSTAARRVAIKEARAVNKERSRLNAENLAAWLAEFYPKHAALVAESLGLADETALALCQEAEVGAWTDDIDIDQRVTQLVALAGEEHAKAEMV